MRRPINRVQERDRGGWRREKGPRSARNTTKVIDAVWKKGKKGEAWAEEEKNVDKDSIGSVNVDPEDLEDDKQAEKEAQGAQELSKNCRESMSPLSRLIKDFRIKCHR